MGFIDVREKLASARAAAHEALRIFADARDVSGYVLVLDAFAALALMDGDEDRAARISGAVANLEHATGTGLNPSNRILHGYDPIYLRDKPETQEAWAAGDAVHARRGDRLRTGAYRSDTAASETTADGAAGQNG